MRVYWKKGLDFLNSAAPILHGAKRWCGVGVDTGLAKTCFSCVQRVQERSKTTNGRSIWVLKPQTLDTSFAKTKNIFCNHKKIQN